MGISGVYVDSFTEANLASAVDVSMNGDYHFFFDVLDVESKSVRLRSHKDGSEHHLRLIKCRGREYTVMLHQGTYSKLFNTPPEKVKIRPFKGERI